MADGVAAIARRLFDALEGADAEALKALHAPGAV